MDPNQLADVVMGGAMSRDWDQSSRDFVELIPIPATRPDPTQLAELISKIKGLTNRDPRPGQILALYYLLYDHRDILFQAATGYGKSMIWQCAPSIGHGICLMVSPLNLLTEQQSARLPEGCKGVGITSQNNTDQLYRDVARGEYTHSNVHHISVPPSDTPHASECVLLW